MASLVSLPTELQNMIFADLSPLDFLNLTATNKDLRVITLPRAYHDITLTWIDPPRRNKMFFKTNTRGLLRALENNPALTKLVKSITLVAKGYMFPKCEEDGTSSYPSMGPLTQWSADLFRDLALIIARCENFSSLGLPIAFLLAGTSFDPFIEGELCFEKETLWLAKLRHVRISADRGDPAWNRHARGPRMRPLYLFQLPNVQTIELEQFEDGCFSDEWHTTRNFWPVRPAPVATSLTTLRLFRSPMCFKSLEVVMNQTPQLRVFEIESLRDICHLPWCLSRLKKAICKVQSTLSSLTVRLDVNKPPYWGLERNCVEEIMWGGLGSFREYQALTHLEVSLPALFGDLNLPPYPDSIDNPEDSEDEESQDFIGSGDSQELNGSRNVLSAVLPPNLQHLVITDDLDYFPAFNKLFEGEYAVAIFRAYLKGERLVEGWAEYDMVEWVPGASEGAWKEATPQLKTFVYDMTRGHPETYWYEEGSVEDLINVCEGQGIKCEVKMDWR